MKRRWLLCFLAAALTVSAAAARNAPEFALPAPDGKTVKLSDYRGKFVVIEIMSPT